LKEKKEDPELKITIVFGKNEDDYSKSMKQDDFNFFKDFPNIDMRYEKRLHAKYYANESAAILTSMNLYSFSQDNNIEAGILTSRKNMLASLTGQNDLENEAYIYFDRVIKQSDLLFSKVPKFESSMLGLSKRHTGSEIKIDKLSEFFNNKKSSDSSFRKENPIAEQITPKMGYCIRTGIPIPFNQSRPMCDTAFQSWKKFGNKDYSEKYCHFSGELSNGDTTFSRPILRKNWVKANETHKL
jgi:hypothetical protein